MPFKIVSDHIEEMPVRLDTELSFNMEGGKHSKIIAPNHLYIKFIDDIKNKQSNK
jgi:hypothetical protein